MLGAMVMDVSPLQGRQMLNIDADTEGMFIVGCAGGCQVTNALPVHRAHFAGETLAIKVSGLVGGHSGMEIGTGRANANKLQGRLLRAACGAADTRLGLRRRRALRTTPSAPPPRRSSSRRTPQRSAPLWRS